jgi:hypothetical protein
VILLCETHSRNRLDFVLPSEFLVPLWDSLLPDKQGGVNFDMIDRGNSDYRLVLKSGRLSPHNGFLGQIAALST